MLKVVFKVNGGMGTLLVRANFIQYFYNKYSDICQIDVGPKSTTDLPPCNACLR